MKEKIESAIDEKLERMLLEYGKTPEIRSAKEDIMAVVRTMPAARRFSVRSILLPVLSAYAIYSLTFLLSLTGNFMFKFLWKRTGGMVTDILTVLGKVLRYSSEVVTFNALPAVVGVALSVAAIALIYRMKIVKGGYNEN